MSIPIAVTQNPDGSWTAKGGSSLTILAVTCLTQNKAVAGLGAALQAVLGKAVPEEPPVEIAGAGAETSEQALKLLSFALSFALCNMDHAGTRRDVKKAQRHLEAYHLLKGKEDHKLLADAEKLILQFVDKCYGIDFALLNETLIGLSKATKA